MVKDMLLSMAGSGESVEIKKISGKDKTRGHLASMGFIEGEKITVVSEMAGGLILDIKGTRIAIDRGMANRIVCEGVA
jgi:hypothetical protein